MACPVLSMLEDIRVCTVVFICIILWSVGDSFTFVTFAKLQVALLAVSCLSVRK